ncbi:MAG: glycosyltransferase family 4 protein [Hungatella sp.]|nr:glycosyltransferase family 4 protein [Hungatella sp.]
MRAVIVTSSSSYEPRADLAADCLKKLGWQTVIISTDFVHREKKRRRESREGYRYLKTIPYQKNLSVKRLWSHRVFSEKVLKELESMEPDLLYILVPANSLVRCGDIYRRNHPKVKVIFDVIDLWPEALPFRNMSGSLPVRMWRSLRDDHLKAADLVVTECRLYREILGPRLKGIETRTIYWPKMGESQAFTEESLLWQSETEELRLCYLGSINHIIDIPFIVNMTVEMKKACDVVFHIIGDGESRQELLDRLRAQGVTVKYHGATYEEEKKREILSQCHYGINMMKPEVTVGLTMKSVEYLYWGLPLLNTIGGDTWRFIEESQAGFNCAEDRWGELVPRIRAGRQDTRMRVNARKLYEQYFSPEAFAAEMEACIGQVVKQSGE